MSGAPSPRSKVEVIECWHLSPEQHSALLSDCLLPLARAHAPAACRGALLSAPSGGDSAAPGAPAAGARFAASHALACASLEAMSREAHLHVAAPCNTARGAGPAKPATLHWLALPLGKRIRPCTQRSRLASDMLSQDATGDRSRRHRT